MVPVDVETVDTWVWLAYDQLNIAFLDASTLMGRLAWSSLNLHTKRNVAPTTSKNWACCCPISAFALELQAAGYPVMYVISRLNYAHILST